MTGRQFLQSPRRRSLSLSPVTILSSPSRGGGASILTDGEQRPPAPREWYLLSGSAIATLVAGTSHRGRSARGFSRCKSPRGRYRFSRLSPAFLLASGARCPPAIHSSGSPQTGVNVFFLSYLRLSLFFFLIVKYLSSVPSSILPVGLTSDSRTRGGSWGPVGVGAASEHRCERSRRHDGTTSRNRWRLIQIRSPRGGDGVVPETAAGTTPGAGQCVAISRPSIQPAVPPWIHLKNTASSASKLDATDPWNKRHRQSLFRMHICIRRIMQFTIVSPHIRDECLFRATAE